MIMKVKQLLEMEIHNKEMVQQEVVKQHLRRIVMLCQFFFDFCSLVLAIFLALGVTDIACLSCRFVARMVGFVIVGVFWNSKETIPYITFLYVLMNHTSCYYRSIQSRYKEIKVMISKQPKSQDSGEKIGEDGKAQGEGQGEGEGEGEGQGQGHNESQAAAGN